MKNLNEYQWIIKSIKIEDGKPPNTKNDFIEGKPSEGYEKQPIIRFRKECFIYSPRYYEIRKVIDLLVEIYDKEKVERELNIEIK